MERLNPTTRTIVLLGVALAAGTMTGVSGPAPDLGSASSGAVLWRAGAERAIEAEWASTSSAPGRITRSNFRVQGEKSYRVEIRDVDDAYGERAELGQALPGGRDDRWFHEGEDRWISMRYYLPASWPSDDTWQTIFQLKPVVPGGGGPDVGLDAGHGSLTVYGNSNVWGSTAGENLDGAGPLKGGGYPLTRSRWIKLTWHVVFSADPAVGRLEVFGDLGDRRGLRRLVPLRRRATMKRMGDRTVPVHLRVGIYRDPAVTGTASLHVDAITVATTRRAAETGAFGPG